MIKKTTWRPDKAARPEGRASDIGYEHYQVGPTDQE